MQCYITTSVTFRELKWTANSWFTVQGDPNYRCTQTEFSFAQQTTFTHIAANELLKSLQKEKSWFQKQTEKNWF